MKITFFPFVLLLSVSTFVNASSLWHDVPTNINARSSTSTTSPYRQIATEKSLIKELLWQAPLEGRASSNTIIDLPLPNGTFVNVQVFESPILSDDIAKQFPQLKTFKVIGVDDPSISGRLDITPKGFHAMLNTADGVIYINPETNYSASASDTLYRSFAKKEVVGSKNFECKTAGHNHKLDEINFSRASAERASSAKNFGSTLKTYRLALSATREYSLAVASGNTTNTFSEMVTAVNRVNQIYQKEVSVKFLLVSGSELISTKTSDFTDSDGGAMLDENQAWIDTKKGKANYDIGHVFSTGGGGLASLAVVCANDNSKAQGVTGSSSPTTDAFYVDYVAHEIGHQLGATHTFNADGSTSGFCQFNRESDITQNGSFLAESAYEVGSGSTIMAYAGICDSQNLQNHSDPYFHARSIEQMRQFVDGDIASTFSNIDGSICGTNTNTGNLAPVAKAGADFIIPANTPFILTGAATDSDSDPSTFTYTWEQYDLGNPSTSLTIMHTDRGKGPIVRSRQGTSNPKRYIPPLSSVLKGTLNSSKGERLPTTDRIMQFMLTVRTGTHGIAQDMMKITVDKEAGPFIVTKPTSTIITNGGNSIAVSWNVANTTAAPVKCAFVDIAYSTNGGRNFSTPLLRDTANDGNANVTLPLIATTNGRIRVKCSTSIFYAVSAK